MSDNIVFTNNASALLAASIDDSGLTVQVAAGYGNNFPVVSSPNYFYLTLEDDAGTIEVVKCTARTVDTDLLTVVRGQEGTENIAHTLNTTRCELRLTKAVMEEFLQKNGGTMTGNLDMDQKNLVDAYLTGSSTRMLAGQIVNVPLRGKLNTSTNEIAVPVDGTSRATAGASEILVAGDNLVPYLDVGGIITLSSGSTGTVIPAGAYLRVQHTWENIATDEVISYLNVYAEDTDDAGVFNFEFVEIDTVNWDTALVMTDSLTMSDNLVIQPVFKDFALTKQAITSTTTTTLNYEDGAYIVLTLDANIASLVLDNPHPTEVCGFRIKIIQDSTPRTIDWPANIHFPNDTEITLSDGAGEVDFVDLWTDDGGTNWFAAYLIGWSP